MDFYKKYELIDALPGEGTRSFRARQASNGREVSVHLLVGGRTPQNDALMARLRAMPPQSLAKLIEVGDNEGVTFVVTQAPPFQHLDEWLASEEYAAAPAARPDPSHGGAWQIPT